MPTVSAWQASSHRAAARHRVHRLERRSRQLTVETLEHRWLLAGQSLLLAGIDDAAASPTNAGLILAADLDSGRQMPLHAQVPFTGAGIGGLAFRSTGELFGSSSAGPGSTSDLVRIDPLTGEEISRVPIVAGGGPIGIADLAAQPASDTIYAVRSTDDGGGGAGQIYTIDAASGAATLVGQANSGITHDGGLAFAPDGTLYYTTESTLTGGPVLHTLNPASAAVLSTVALTGSLGFSTGLGFRAATGTLVGSGAANGDIVSVDPATGVRTVIPLDAPARGIMGDLAFQPDSPIVELVHHADFEGSNDGYSADNTGGTFPGLWHYSLGRRDDGLLNHSPTHAWYYGAFEGPRGEGRYDVFPGDHQGVLISPLIQLPEQGTSILSFSYVLDTRLPFDVDFLDVLIDNGDGEPTIVKSRQDGTLLQSSHEMWLTATADISAFNGQEIRVLFRFNTGDVPRVDPEGWYVDDVQISNVLELGSIAWEKRDATNSALLGGATFTITPSPLTGNGSLQVLDNGSFDANPDAGQILVANVLWGVYTVTETIPPTGYGTDPNPARQVEVKATELNPVIEVDFQNPRLPGAITWEKRDATNDALLGGATFTVTPNPLTGNGSLQVLDNGPFDADLDAGQILVANVLWSVYTVTETIPPTGYDTDPNPARQVEVKATELNPIIEVDFQNSRLAGSIQWEKRDATNDALLGGATFTVTPNPLTGNGSLQVLDNGPLDADLDAGQILVANVLWSVYTVTETIPPTGYDTDPNPARQVEVKATELNPDIEVDFQNPRLPGSITWEKRDATNDALLGGATFTVTPSPLTGNGSLQVLDNGPLDADLDAGQILVANVLWSVYTVTETIPPTGYDTDPNPARQVEVKATELNPDIEVDFQNPRLPVEVVQIVQTVQFITPMSVYRVAGPFTTGDNKPPEGNAAITGYKWHDVNQNGQWDAGEPGRSGWTIFIDSNGDGILDPQTERFAVTDANGQYTLGGLAAGTYTVVEDRAGLSDGTFNVQTFPAANAIGRHVHVVTLSAGQTLAGSFETTATPNFGGFDYSPFVRPADDTLGHLRAADAATRTMLLAALGPWQIITITNPLAVAIAITDILKSFDQTIPVADQFVTVTDGNLNAISLPLPIGPGATIELFAFYDPAVRSGDTVLEQYPDWFNDPATGGNESNSRPAHTFGPDDRLEIVTDADVSYQVFLIGGSTYDSDIVYTGSVNLADFGRLDDFLGVKWPMLAGAAGSAFEPTSDINARFPNGAGASIAAGSWPLTGVPPREFGLGDFAPLNVEFGRTRAPFLDLDADNSSGQRGTDYTAGVSEVEAAAGVRIADFDARFANQLTLNLVSLEIRLSSPPDSAEENFAFDTSGTNITGVSQFVGGARVLTLTGSDTVANYARVIDGVRYVNNAAAMTLGARNVEIVATGGTDFTALNDAAERIGNRAVATLEIEAIVVAPAVVLAIVSPAIPPVDPPRPDAATSTAAAAPAAAPNFDAAPPIASTSTAASAIQSPPTPANLVAIATQPPQASTRDIAAPALAASTAELQTEPAGIEISWWWWSDSIEAESMAATDDAADWLGALVVESRTGPAESPPALVPSSAPISSLSTDDEAGHLDAVDRLFAEMDTDEMASALIGLPPAIR